MASKEELQILLTMKDNATKEMIKAEKQMGKMGSSLKKIGAVAKTVAIGLTAIGAVAVVAGTKAVKAFQEQERAEARLAQLTKQTTGATAEQVKVLTDQAKALQKVGVVGDEVTIMGQSQLATFGLTTDKIAELTPSLLDMAVATKGVNATQEDMINIGNAVGRAIEGGAGALTRYGISLTDAQKEQFAMADKMERATLLAEILQDNFGGLNEATRATSEGGVKALKNSFGDLMEMVGEKLVPVLQFLVDKGTVIVEAFSSVMSAGGGLKQFFADFFNFIDEKTGLITILTQSWDNLVVIFQQRLLPVLQILWDKLQPMKPFFEILAKIIGVILYGALIAFIKLLEGSLIIIMLSLQKGLELGIKSLEIWTAGWNKLTDILAKVVGWIDNMIEKIKKLNVIQGASNLISKAIGFVSGKALGGSVYANQPVKVGENGEEMFVPNTSGKIIPNRQLTGGGGGVTVNVYGDATGTEIIEKVKEGIMLELQLNNRITVGT